MSTVIGFVSLVFFMANLWVADGEEFNLKMAAVYLAIAAWCFH